HHPQARAHDGRRRDCDERTGQGIGVHGALARGREDINAPEREVQNETSPPNFSASDSGRCRAAGRVARRVGASLPVAAGALGRRCPAGGGNDIIARLIGQWLSERLGQPFVIENRAGGAGNIATEAVVRAVADGYTLLLVTGTNAINATLYEKLSFNF